MSNLYFDLNIYNYSIKELQYLIKLPEIYNFQIIEEYISVIKNKILGLKLSINENNEFLLFLNNIKLFLKSHLEEEEKKILKQKIINLKNTQEKMKDELKIMRKNKEKIKKE